MAGAVVAYALRPAWRPRLRLAGALAAVVLIVGAAATGGDLVGGFGRTEAMSLSLDVARDNPLTGVGPRAGRRRADRAGRRGRLVPPLAQPVAIWLVEAGPLALIAWVWIAGWLLWRGYRAAGRGRALAAS